MKITIIPLLFIISIRCDLIPQIIKICPTFSKVNSNYKKMLILRKQSVSDKNIWKKYGFKNNNEFVKQYMSSGVEVQNLKNLMYKSLSKPELIAKGAFGAVFNYQQRSFSSHDNTIHRAVKLIKVGSNLKISNNVKDQMNLYREIVINYKLFGKKNGKYFFPTIFGCNVLTNPIKESLSTLPAELLKTNPIYRQINHQSSNKEFIIIKIEKLSYSYGDYLMTQRHANKLGDLTMNRIKMARNLLTGLKIINEETIYCDVKSENLMIQLLDSKSANNPFVIRTIHGEKILIKYIDFGSTVPKNKKCTSGSPGFIPPEIRLKDRNHSKFDVFSLGIVLINSELAHMKFDFLNEINGILFYDITRNRKKITSVSSNYLKTSQFFKQIEYIFTQQYCNSLYIYLQKLEKEFKTMDMSFLQYIGEPNLESIFMKETPPSLMSLNPKLLEILVFYLTQQLIRNNFLNANIFKSVLVENLLIKERTAAEQTLAQNMKLLNKGTEITNLNNLIKLYRAKEGILMRINDDRREYFQIITQMIEWNPDWRISTEEAQQRIFKLVKNHESDLKQNYELVLKYEENTSEDKIQRIYNPIEFLHLNQVMRGAGYKSLNKIKETKTNFIVRAID